MQVQCFFLGISAHNFHTQSLILIMEPAARKCPQGCDYRMVYISQQQEKVRVNTQQLAPPPAAVEFQC